MPPQRKTARLRFGRVSMPGARYFVTCVVKDRRPVFREQRWSDEARAALATMHHHGDVVVLAANIMPDHVHILATLGTRLAIGRVIAKFKTLARARGSAPWRWVSDAFEHRLRENEDVEDYGFYSFMNPYRAGFVSSDQTWPGWVCPEPRAFRFMEQLRPGNLPQDEWYVRVENLNGRIATGE